MRKGHEIFVGKKVNVSIHYNHLTSEYRQSSENNFFHGFKTLFWYYCFCIPRRIGIILHLWLVQVLFIFGWKVCFSCKIFHILSLYSQFKLETKLIAELRGFQFINWIFSSTKNHCFLERKEKYFNLTDFH